MISNWSRLLLVLILTFSSSISSSSNRLHNSSTSKPLPQLSFHPLTSFTAKGKIAFQQGKQGGNANFQWHQSGHHFTISIIGALGAGSLDIQNHGHTVTLKTSKGETYTATTPEELLKKVLGWTVPITPMQYWLQGVPAPKLPIKLALSEDGKHLSFLEQAGWKVTYQSYMQVGPRMFPQKILLQHGKVRLRIVFKDWS